MLGLQIRQSHKTEIFHHSYIVDISGFDSGFLDEHFHQSTRRISRFFSKSDEKSGLTCGINFDFGEIVVGFRIQTFFIIEPQKCSNYLFWTMNFKHFLYKGVVLVIFASHQHGIDVSEELFFSLGNDFFC